MNFPPIECLYVNEHSVREWKSGNPNFKISESVPLPRFVYELCWTIVRGELPFQKCKTALKSVEFLGGISDEDIGSTFADVVTQMAQDITMVGENRTRLAKLSKWLVESSLVPLRTFHERAEEEFLWECEMIKMKAHDLKSKEVRVNTRLLYQQTKFNLLREESEGYAKLITLLFQVSEVDNDKATSATIGIIKSLIGHFDLDPNRVFDIVLEALELHSDNSFLDMVPIFPKSHTSQILGSKFQYYQRIEVTESVPFGLYRLTALLVKNEFIDLDTIYSHLLPNDDESFEQYNVFCAKRLDEANNIGKINLAATGRDLMDDEKQGDVAVDLYAALDLEAGSFDDRLLGISNSQTLGLLAGFLFVDDWFHAQILFDRLSLLIPASHARICDQLFRIIEKSITSAYNIVRQMRLQNSGSSVGGGSESIDLNLRGFKSFVNVDKQLFEMLVVVGPYLHRNTLLLQKVCRVLKGYYLSALKLQDAGTKMLDSDSCFQSIQNPSTHLKEAKARIEEALGKCLLPSLQLIPANPAVGLEIWEVMLLLPYEVRYRLYGEWEKDDEPIPMILAARQTAKLDTRRILKRLVKENLKQLGRMVAKLAHANPLTVLRTIVHQMEAYKDMIIPVVDAFKYLSQLEYDILEYVVIERLAQAGRDKLKDDGLNVSDWLQSLASFWGHLYFMHFIYVEREALHRHSSSKFTSAKQKIQDALIFFFRCKKYPSMELRGLFQYLVNQLKKGNGIELVLLQELIQQMANVQYTENMTEDQLDAMGGSDTLRYQATSFGIPRNNKALVKSTNRLRDSLLPKEDPVLAIPLLLLIAQHRSVIVINADVSHIKIVSEEFDRCHGTLLQYVEFLTGGAMPVTAYAQLVPSLNDLVCQYHLDPEVAFLIYRPIMRLFKSVGGDISWPLNDIKSEADSGNEKDPEQIEIDIDLVLDSGCGGKHPRWSNLLDTVKTMLPPNAWKSLTPDLYATFWGLTLYDLYVPRNCYDSEISKLHATLKSLEEISDNSSSSITKRKKDKERIQESLDRLTSELQQHEENVASVRRRLTREKDTWLSSCPDTLKINMEFLQRCIFPRCTFSMPDAAYCAVFVQTLHSLGTPFFNTVNHIDVLICKTLHPMICCCTEFEAGRLGRFLYETLKIAYYWKSDESVYERECGNMPGFAVYYRFPNSQRVTFGQFIKVHWKWSQRITRLLIQCLESTEYMEIRNALILLTKISSVFPATRKSGINLEKRVLKIKGDEREDLKVLAMGVAAALATRKPFWVTEEEFGMGYLELKPVSSALPKPLNNSVTSAPSVVSQHEGSGSRPALHPNPVKELTNGKTNGVFPVNGLEVSTQLGPAKATANVKPFEETPNRSSEDNSATKVPSKAVLESQQARSVAKRQLPPHSSSITKVSKPDSGRDDYRVGRGVGRSPDPHPSEGRPGPTINTSPSVAANGNTSSVLPKVTSAASAPTEYQGDELRAEAEEGEDNHTAVSSSHHVQDTSAASPLVKPGEKVPKRAGSTEDHDRIGRRRRGDVETESRFPEKAEGEGAGQEQLEKIPDRSRDRSGEKAGREKSVELLLDRIPNRVKEDRGRIRHGESDKIDERFHGQGFPLPPSHMHPNIIHQSLSLGRRDEDASERRLGTSRHPQRLSPRHDEKERRRPEGSPLILHEDGKRRREDEFRDRKILAIKQAEEGERERDQEREKAILMKEEIDGEVISSKRRKLKREHIPSGEVDEYPSAVPHPSLSLISSQTYDVRERGERKSILPQRPGYMEDSGSLRIHVKDVTGKIARRDADIMYDREWDEEKRLRMEAKRRHRK